MKGYRLIAPPCHFRFSRLSRQELELYGRWFMSSIDDRLAVLSAAVRETPGGGFELNFRTDSLLPLGEWLAQRVFLRKRTELEKQEISRAALPEVAVPEHELTDESISMAFDVGVYLGNVFTQSNAKLFWQQQFLDKRDIDYGQPTICGFKQGRANPVRLTQTFAYGVAERRVAPARLHAVAEFWLRSV